MRRTRYNSVSDITERTVSAARSYIAVLVIERAMSGKIISHTVVSDAQNKSVISTRRYFLK